MLSEKRLIYESSHLFCTILRCFKTLSNLLKRHSEFNFLLSLVRRYSWRVYFLKTSSVNLPKCKCICQKCDFFKIYNKVKTRLILGLFREILMSFVEEVVNTGMRPPKAIIIKIEMRRHPIIANVLNDCLYLIVFHTLNSLIVD